MEQQTRPWYIMQKWQTKSRTNQLSNSYGNRVDLNFHTIFLIYLGWVITIGKPDQHVKLATM